MRDFVAHNNEITEAAVAKVRSFTEMHDGARFAIHYKGFGSGGTAGILAENAVRYIRDLASTDDPHYRYQARIEWIEIEVTIPKITISL